MAGIKIVDLPALGRDLISTDLLELSLAGGTGSRKITGQEIMNASKLSVGNTPVVSGTIGRIFFQGTGNVLQQSGNLFWDDAANRFIIGGSTASNVRSNTNEFNIQRDGLTVPTGGSQLMFNLVGNGQGMTITNQNGTTYRIGQYAASNVLTLGVSGNSTLNLFTSGNIGINTTTDAGFRLDVNGTARVTSLRTTDLVSPSPTENIFVKNSSGVTAGRILPDGNILRIASSGAHATINIFSTGNLGINQTTDDGFRLDVNGTARVSGASCFGTASGNVGIGTTDVATPFSTAKGLVINAGAGNDAQVRLQNTSTGNTTSDGGLLSISNILMYLWNYEAGPLILGTGNAERLRIFSTGNIGINTTTDAGFRLDVNGTARVQGNVTVTGTNISISNAAMSIDSNVGTGIFNLINSSGSAGNTRMSLGGVTYFNIYQPINASSGILSGTINTITTPLTYAWASGSASPNLFQLNPNYNFTGTYAGTARGFYYNPTLTSIVGLTHFAFHSTSGRVRFEGLPTSPTGLNAGDLYNNLGVLMIV